MLDPDAHLAGHFGDLVDTDALADLVVIAVAGKFQTIVEIDVSVATTFPAVEPRAADLCPAFAIDSFLGADRTSFKRCEACHHFKGRSRRIGTLHGLGRERTVFVFVQVGPGLN